MKSKSKSSNPTQQTDPLDGEQPCGICRKLVSAFPRYPRYLCHDCAAKAADSHGRRLLFSNVDFSGGYKASYADTGEPYDSHQCFVDGLECRADEARFGGIVIEAVSPA